MRLYLLTGDLARPIFVIPLEKEMENVEEVGDDASIVFITTPGDVTFSSFRGSSDNF
jgi:hypothetical protein